MRWIESYERVAEQALARTFQVSRTLIRGALNVLLEENLLSHEAGKGYRLLAAPAGQAFSAASSIRRSVKA